MLDEHARREAPEIGSQPGGQPKTARTFALQCNRRVIEDRKGVIL